MPAFTIRNPLQVGASGQSDGSAYRALAESLAQQGMQAGPSGGLNILQAILQPLAQTMNMNRAAEADAAFEEKRIKRYEEAMTARERAKLQAEHASTAAQRKQREEFGRANGLSGLALAQYVEKGDIPDALLTPAKPQGPIKVGRSLVDPVTLKPVYTDPAAPQAPRIPTEFEQRRDWLKANDPEGYKRFMAGNAAPEQPKAPAGFRWNADGSALEKIPGGPAEQGGKPPTAEAANKLAQWENALREAEAYRAAVVSPEGDFADLDARLPENQRRLQSAVRAKLRGESGATITEDESKAELERYGPRVFSSDATNVAAIDRMISDLKNQISSVRGSATEQAAAGSASVDPEEGRTATNPQTGQKIVKRNGQWVPVG